MNTFSLRRIAPATTEIRKHIHVLLILVVAGFTAFHAAAQSAKKQNEQLLFSLDSAKREYQLANDAYRSLYSYLKEMRNEYTAIRSIGIRSVQNQLKNALHLIEANYAQLQRLGEDPSRLVSIDNVKEMVFATIEVAHPEAVKVALQSPVPFMEVKDTLELDGLKRKQQNLLLQKQLLVYKEALSENKERIALIQNYNAQLLKGAQQLDSVIMAVYRRPVMAVVAEHNKLDAKIQELKTNYLAKEGKGFSEAYTTEFGSLLEEEPLQEMDAKEPSFFAPQEAVQVPEPRPQSEPEILEIAEKAAEFPGGSEALLNYLKHNLRYPAAAEEIGIVGKCYVRFVVSASGNISNVKVLKGVPDCPECDREAIRVVKAMPNWIPAENNGKKVNMFYNLPIRFGPAK